MGDNIYLLPVHPSEDPAYGPFEDWREAERYREKVLGDRGHFGVSTPRYQWIISGFLIEPTKPRKYIEVVLRKDVTNDDGWQLYAEDHLPQEWTGDDPICIPGPWEIVSNRYVTE